MNTAEQTNILTIDAAKLDMAITAALGVNELVINQFTGQVEQLELTTTAGYQEAVSVQKDIRTVRLSVDEKRKDLGREARERIAMVNERGAAITEKLVALENAIKLKRQVIDEEKERVRAEKARKLQEAAEAEASRVQGIKVKIEENFGMGRLFALSHATAKEVFAVADSIQALAVGEEYQEFQVEAQEAKDQLMAKLAVHHHAVTAAEAEAARQKVEAERLEDERKKLEQEQRLARERLEEERRELEEARRKEDEERIRLQKIEDRKRKAEEELLAKEKLIIEEQRRKNDEARKRIEDEARKKEEAESRAKFEQEAMEKAASQARDDAEKEQLRRQEEDRAKRVEAERREALRPDREKLEALAASLASMKLPTVESDPAKQVLERSARYLASLSQRIMEEASTL